MYVYCDYVCLCVFMCINVCLYVLCVFMYVYVCLCIFLNIYVSSMSLCHKARVGSHLALSMALGLENGRPALTELE